jgi:hypothetical protein
MIYKHKVTIVNRKESMKSLEGFKYYVFDSILKYFSVYFLFTYTRKQLSTKDLLDSTWILVR